MALTSARVRAVNAVFEAGNFSAAARRLGVSQPSVAQLVRELESEFDVRLFERHGHILLATPLCRQLYAATNRIQAMEADAVAILGRLGCVVVLKGSGTVLAAPGELPRINPTGNARLATAGTGDVLAGLVAARLATGAQAMDAAADAVYAHGAAADAWPAGLPLVAGQLAGRLTP